MDYGKGENDLQLFSLMHSAVMILRSSPRTTMIIHEKST